MKTIENDTLRTSVDAAPVVRAGVILRRNVVRTIARDDARSFGDEHHFRSFEDMRPHVERLQEQLVTDLEIGGQEAADAQRLYLDAFRDEWHVLTGVAKPSAEITNHELRKERVREQLCMLAARAWIGGAIGGAHNELRADVARAADDAAPSLIEGALDAIMQVLA